MREASYDDAVVIGRELNLNKDEVWKIVQGIRFSSHAELSMAIHREFKLDAIIKGALTRKDP